MLYPGICSVLSICLASLCLLHSATCYSYGRDRGKDLGEEGNLDTIQKMYQQVRNWGRLVRHDADQEHTPSDEWPGKWFPNKPSEKPVIYRKPQEMNHRQQQMWSMINSTCDDGKTNLTVDWPGTLYNYTCLTPKNLYTPDPSVSSLIIKDTVPPAYKARHVCMQSEINYDSNLPTYGPHRPAWPRYGEYKFVPRQRWIHNLEHGAVVMLYHPCAHPFLVSKLRKIVESCLYRHIITPFTLLNPDRPLALVTWGWALLMSDIDREIVTDFIQHHALKGPEHLSQDGQYDYMLLTPAKIVSNQEDDVICPRGRP